MTDESKFMSAEALRIPQQARDAMIRMLHKMEAGDIVKMDLPHEWSSAIDLGLLDLKEEIADSARFNMKIAASSVEDCGTVLCMFGILCAMGGDVFGLTRDDDPDKSVAGLMINMALGDYSEHLELMALFMPGNISVAGLDDITVAQAARQLRLYLTTGTHEWVSDVAPAEL